MSQEQTSMPAGGIGKIQWQDVWRGLIKTTGGLILGVVITMIHDKALPTYDQISPFLEACAYFFASYIGINAATNNVGQFLKKDKETITVSTAALDDLQEKANKQS